MNLLLPLALAALALGVPSAARAQSDAPVPAPQPADGVLVPTWPNSTCPIMGKPISARLYTDTKLGRIYICCKACVKDIQADVEHAYKTAFPTTEKIANKVCPVTGAPLGKDAVRVELQGREFLVADKAAAALAAEDSQATLAKAHDMKLVDVRNATCPTTAEPVGKNVIAVIDGRIVRFASAKAIDEARKEPKKALAKALELRAAEDRARADEAAKGGAPKPAGG